MWLCLFISWHWPTNSYFPDFNKSPQHFDLSPVVPSFYAFQQKSSLSTIYTCTYAYIHTLNNYNNLFLKSWFS
jgi:hypothetical protein